MNTHLQAAGHTHARFEITNAKNHLTNETARHTHPPWSIHTYELQHTSTSTRLDQYTPGSFKHTSRSTRLDRYILRKQKLHTRIKGITIAIAMRSSPMVRSRYNCTGGMSATFFAKEGNAHESGDVVGRAFKIHEKLTAMILPCCTQKWLKNT